MSNEENELLNTPEVDRLVTLIEEVTRATAGAPTRFIEPARGTLNRALSRRHHLIFGRRGSGKTSLIRKASADLQQRSVPTAFVDLEAFKGHKYPDILLSILIETLRAFKAWFDITSEIAEKKKSLLEKLHDKFASGAKVDRARTAEISKELDRQTEELLSMLHSEDGAIVKGVTTASQSNSASNTSEDAVSANVGIPHMSGGANSKSSTNTSNSSTTGIEYSETTKRNKSDYLIRKIIDFQKLFESISALSGSGAYIFLDDLYHINRGDQADVLDYFHRIAKGRSVWLKVGTIRHRTEWYRHGNPPIGLKLGDDADDIDLDITLEKYKIARTFLLQILDNLLREVSLPGHENLLVEGGTGRLVLACGGVARDFLTIFRRAIEVARERGETYRGNRINAEDVNIAAGEHDPTKRDELKRDTVEERQALENALAVIQQFCIENKVNCFLVERDIESLGHTLIGELVDLRFVHIVEARTTVRDVQGKLFTAYMLDISQYTGDRKRRELEMIDFWTSKGLDRIRRSKYVLDARDLEARNPRLI